MKDVADGFSAWAVAKLNQGRPVEVTAIEMVPGGASRETFIIAYREGADEPIRRIVLRRDPVDSLIDTDRRVEFEAYAAFQDSDVPVPRTIALEYEPRWLERPFSVMEMVEGCHADPKLFERAPLRDLRESIGEQKFNILGRIAAADPALLGLDTLNAAPNREDIWRRELDYWAGVIDDDEIEPQPVVRMAIRALRRNPPPPPAKLSIVHGDYRSGNFLFDDQGVVRAILDWEMCHLGDGLEDLAWAFSPIYCGGDTSRVGRLISREAAIAHWQAASGLKVDNDALRWWELFTSVKALAIYISAAKVFEQETNTNLIMILPAWFGMEQVNRTVLKQLEDWR